jgi:predicted nucleic acid-binding protein
VILVDTSAIVAAQLVTEDRHAATVAAFRDLRTQREEFLIPGTVLAETGYLLRTIARPSDEVTFLRAVAEGDFTVVPLTGPDLDRIADLAHIYVDHPLGVTDASLIALAERLGITTIVTLNPRDFRAVRPRHTDAFTLLPSI